MRRPELDDLLHHVPLLVDLDRVDGGVASLVAELLDRAGEPVGQLGDPRLQDVGEAEQQREPDALRVQVGRDLVEVDAALGHPIRMHRDVALLVHAEVAQPPARHIVELLGVGDRPARRIGVGGEDVRGAVHGHRRLQG
ncbi:MAG: hypothetical protein V9E87_11440 [Gemmatimonadales bacterium]